MAGPVIRRNDVIDVHAHAVLDATLGQAGAAGPEILVLDDGRPAFRTGQYQLNGVRYRGSPFMDPELRIERMAQSGITVQVLSPNPLTYFHHIDRQDAIRFCRIHNDALAALVARYPDKFVGLAALPVQDVDAAIAELERAVTELGLHGGMIGTNFGTSLDAPAHDPLYETFTRLNVPLFLHPNPAGIDGPAGDPRLKRFELDILFGFTIDETLAVIDLVMGGVLHRHPTLDVCVSHGGGSLPFVHGRLKQACQKRAWVPEFLRPEGAFESFIHRIWFDTHVHGLSATALLAEIANPDRLVYGTNFAGWDQDESPAATGLDPKILTKNAARLLRLPYQD